MTDSMPARLSSSYLEDLAVIALTAPRDVREAGTNPALDDGQRARLRSRLKQIGRHDWPASLKEDPLLRRGYTLRQCFRLIVALQLIDAQLPPSTAIPIATNNEMTLLRIIVDRLGNAHAGATARDQLAIVPLGELWEQVDPQQAGAAELPRVRALAREELSALWASETNLAFPGQRLVLDVGTAANSVWSWLQHRRLMPVGELDLLKEAVDADRGAPGYVKGEGKITRR